MADPVQPKHVKQPKGAHGAIANLAQAKKDLRRAALRFHAALIAYEDNVYDPAEVQDGMSLMAALEQHSFRLGGSLVAETAKSLKEA